MIRPLDGPGHFARGILIPLHERTDMFDSPLYEPGDMTPDERRQMARDRLAFELDFEAGLEALAAAGDALDAEAEAGGDGHDWRFGHGVGWCERCGLEYGNPGDCR